MGKKKIQIIDDYQSEETTQGKPKKKKLGRKDPLKKLAKAKADKNQSRLANMGVIPPEEEGAKAVSEDKAEDLNGKGEKITPQDKDEKSSSKKKIVKKKQRSKRYQSQLKKIDRTKLYPLKEAVNILLKLSKTKNDETVEIHLKTDRDKLSGEVKLPHGTGKKINIVIFDDKVLKELEKGKTDFDMLVAKPSDMSKLAKYAKVLGPKGLFPNPKNGTIAEDPDKTVKELSGGKSYYKSEVKYPLIHFTIGKTSFGEKKILENLEVFIKTIGASKVKKATLSSTHSPGIKLEIEK